MERGLVRGVCSVGGPEGTLGWVRGKGVRWDILVEVVLEIGVAGAGAGVGVGVVMCRWKEVEVGAESVLLSENFLGEVVVSS